MTGKPEWATAPPEDGNEGLEVVRLDAERGLSIRAQRRFAAGTTIHHFAGVIGRHVCQHSLQVDAKRHISGTRYIGYLSHGCEPNCRLDMRDFTLVTLVGIEPGDVLTIDYAETEDRLHRQFACRCGAGNCRGWIHGRLEGPNAEGRAWLAACHAG